MRKQEGDAKLGLVEECRIGILPVCPAPVATGPSQNNAKACDQTENKQVPSYNRTKDWAVYELKHGQMMLRVVDNLFGREAALLLQPGLHVHHLRVN